MAVRARVRVNWRGDDFRARMYEAVNAGLTDAARTHANIVRGSFSGIGRYVPSAPGTPPNVRRGFLRGGVTYTPSVNLRAASGVRRGIPYAAVHEFGGVVRAARSRYLPVPVNAQAMRINERKGSASLRSVLSGARVFRSKRGNLVLVGPSRVRVLTGYRGGRAVHDTSVPVWVLRRSVRMPRRAYMRPAYVRNKQEIWSAAIRTARRVLFGGGARGGAQ